jgi:hypothetical protein
MSIEIRLSNGMVATVDDHDHQLVSELNWHAAKNGATYYAYAKRSGKTLTMHRLVMGILDASDLVDHRDLDGLNNTKANLRICCSATNNMNRKKFKNNTSGFKGVVLDNRDMKWQAQIYANGKRVCLGRYASPDEAHRAYVKAAHELHGEFARPE